jgi:hypothetical protein
MTIWWVLAVQVQVLVQALVQAQVQALVQAQVQAQVQMQALVLAVANQQNFFLPMQASPASCSYTMARSHLDTTESPPPAHRCHL